MDLPALLLIGSKKFLFLAPLTGIEMLAADIHQFLL